MINFKRHFIIACLFFVLIFSNESLFGQKYFALGLEPQTYLIENRNFYVAEVLDNRVSKESIGVISAGRTRKMSLVRFGNDFTDELQNFFNIAIPPDSSQAPVVVQINRFWVSEVQKEDLKKAVCDIEMEFLTPNHQSVYTVKITEDYTALDVSLVHAENIETAIINCLKSFNKSDWFGKYLEAIENESPQYIAPDTVIVEPIEQKKIRSNQMFGTADNTFRIGIKGGWSYRLAKIPDGYEKEFEDYMKKLLSGWHLGGDMSFYWNESNGAGIYLSNFKSSNIMTDVSMFDEFGNLIAVGDIKDEMNIFYVGPAYYYQQSLSRSSIMHGSVSFGYLSYTDDAFVVVETLKLKGKALGMGVSVGMDFFISDDFALGFELAAIMGSLSKLEINGQSYNLNESESLTHLNFSLVLHLYP